MTKPRSWSATNVYHVVIKGNNQVDVFCDEEDNRKFLYILEDLQEDKRVEVYAYCMMVNHAHLMIRVTKGTVADVMRSALIRYVRWYNKKYERTGRLFEDRFFSNTVSNRKYFIAGLNYIYNNPVKAGLCASPADYKWSSFRQLLVSVKNMPKVAPPLNKLPLGEQGLYILDSDLDLSSWEPHKNLYDTETMEMVKSYLGLQEWKEVQNLEAEKLEKCINFLVHEGASQRQISRVLGVTRHNIKKILDQYPAESGNV